MTNEFIWGMCLSLLVLGVGLWRLALKFPSYRKGIMGFYLVFQVGYLIWRLTGTIPTSSIEDTALGVLLLLTELLSFTQTAVFILLFANQEKKTEHSSFSYDFVPTVDIFIATYNEEIELLEKTVVAAKLVDYPKEKRTIYLCDDGNRPEVRALAEKWAVHYLARVVNKGAKAGNLNYGLAHSTSEFVVTMDADMMMKPGFLKETVPFFKDSKMGFVQTPQAFHNPDVFQHNLYAESKVRNDQDFFMRFLQAAKNRFNAVIYVGSNAIFRRTALESVDGFVTNVITEDMATGLLLQNQGWKSEFLNKVLATGLSPETFRELIKQRVRWAKGNVQVFKNYSPRTLTNLSILQKLLYIDGVHYWFFGFYHFLYLLFPIISILFGVQIIGIHSVLFLPIWLVSYILSKLVFSSVAGKEFRPMWASVAELAIFPHVMWAITQELIGHKTRSFAVTTKGQTIEKTTRHWGMMLVQLIFLMLSIISLAIIALKLKENPFQTLTLWALPLFWLSYNILCLIGALHISVDRPRYKEQLVSCNSKGVLKYGEEKIPVHINKIHAGKAVIQAHDGRLPDVKKGKESILEMEDGFSLPVQFLKAVPSAHSVAYSVGINKLNKETYQEFFNYLDQLNTTKFKVRQASYKRPVYHLTIGYYIKKYQVKAAAKY